jgi:hypothetical protein
MGMDQQQFPMFSSTPSGNQLLPKHPNLPDLSNGIDLTYRMDNEPSAMIFLESSEGIRSIKVELKPVTKSLGIVCHTNNLPTLQIYSSSYFRLCFYNKVPLFVSRIVGQISDITHENDLRIGSLEVVDLDDSQLIVRMFDRCDKVFLYTGQRNVIFIDRLPKQYIEIKVPRLGSEVHVFTSRRCNFDSEGRCFAGQKCACLNQYYYFADKSLEAPHMELIISSETTESMEEESMEESFELKIIDLEENPFLCSLNNILDVISEYFMVKLSAVLSRRPLADLRLINGPTESKRIMDFANELLKRFKSKEFCDLVNKCEGCEDSMTLRIMFNRFLQELNTDRLMKLYVKDGKRKRCYEEVFEEEEVPEKKKKMSSIDAQTCPLSFKPTFEFNFDSFDSFENDHEQEIGANNTNNNTNTNWCSMDID